MEKQKLGSKYSPDELHPVLHTTNLGEELPFHPCTSHLETAQALGEYAEIPADAVNGLPKQTYVQLQGMQPKNGMEFGDYMLHGTKRLITPTQGVEFLAKKSAPVILS
jgi:hypothetical protein